MSVKVSIVIPVYNIQNHLLHSCLQSAVSQTLDKIEIICVDDHSSNNSLSLLREFARNDRRIRIISLEKNMGTCFARKAGVQTAKGKYLLFLDADDTLEVNACSVLYDQMELNGVDVLQFGTSIIAEKYLEPERIRRSNKNLQPYPGYLYGKDILDGCFKNKLYRFTLWNKIYRTTVVKKAFRHLSEEYLIKAEDAYTYFLIASYARSYYGLRDCKLYNYHFGVGITGRTELSLHRLDQYCQNMCAWDALKNFIHTQDLPYYKSIFLPRFRADLLSDVLVKYYRFLPTQMQEDGMKILLKYWDYEELEDGFNRAGVFCHHFIA